MNGGMLKSDVGSIQGALNRIVECLSVQDSLSNDLHRLSCKLDQVPPNDMPPKSPREESEGKEPSIIESLAFINQCLIDRNREFEHLKQHLIRTI